MASANVPIVAAVTTVPGPAHGPARRTYLLDTSVLLADPRAIFRFAEHNVVVPLVSLAELEANQNHSVHGESARAALWLLDEVRTQAGHLGEPITVSEAGGQLRLLAADEAALAAGDEGLGGTMVSVNDHDRQVLALTAKLTQAGEDVRLVSKNLPLRVRAGALGLAAEPYRAELAKPSGWTGLGRLAISEPNMSRLLLKGKLSLGSLDLSEADLNSFVAHQGLVLISPTGSALGRVHPDGTIGLIRPDQDAFGALGQSVEQRIAIDVLLDEDIGIVSLGGPAGTGKTALALSAALESVLERREHRRILVFRPQAVAGKDASQSVLDTLAAMVSRQIVDELLERDLLQVFPLEQIRGRSLHDSFVIVDDAQALDRNELLMILSRMGQNSRVVFTHDISKRLNLRVSKEDGIATIIEQLKGHPLFAHVTLTGSQRSAIAELASQLAAN